MRIKLSEKEIKEAVELYIARRLSLEYHPIDLTYYFCNDKDEVVNLEYVEILFP